MLTYMLSPLIIYSPSGTISTASSVEKTRSTAEERMMLVWRSYPLNEPFETNKDATDSDRKTRLTSAVDWQSYHAAWARSGRFNPERRDEGRRGGATTRPTELVLSSRGRREHVQRSDGHRAAEPALVLMTEIDR